MTVIKTVAVTGASGAVGTAVVNAIVESGKFNVSVLARTGSKAAFPSSVKIAYVDYSDVASLTEAFRGNDAVISTVGLMGLQGQTTAVEAAVAAGVKRFLPSEFGYDLEDPKIEAITANLPIFGAKVNVKKLIEEKAASNPDFTYTYVYNGTFLDWGLEHSFLFDLQSGKPRIFDGGDRPFSTTTLKSTAQAVVGVLEHPDETKNRAVYIQDLVLTQNKIFALAKKVAPEKTKSWEPVPTSTTSIKGSSDAALAKGDDSLPVLFEYLYVLFFGEGYDAEYKELDNELLGIAGDKSDADIEAILAPILN
ncbi:isoflavone reductase family protein-like protein CipA [Mollisia scopiformis]|uniref:Isoflavone reductase family protein-like protein CipA n=1 Tax=Mollisia scopiformis TaxID=149040 RepID=A0A194XBY0_MOLSC|nr:isoflavone reductase family protein-like protein CipA [Mollisia scopiformis]KUJ17666.1 isoflavone reductase family protein-like protein CipA [Mollisia scopiformis]